MFYELLNIWGYFFNPSHIIDNLAGHKTLGSQADSLQQSLNILLYALLVSVSPKLDVNLILSYAANHFFYLGSCIVFFFTFTFVSIKFCYLVLHRSLFHRWCLECDNPFKSVYWGLYFLLRKSSHPSLTPPQYCFCLAALKSSLRISTMLC